MLQGRKELSQHKNKLSRMNEGDLLGTWQEAFIAMFLRVIFSLNSWRLSTTSVSPHFLVQHLCHICHLAWSISIWMSTQDLLPRVMPPKKEEKLRKAKRGRWVMHLCSRAHLRPCCRWMCVRVCHFLPPKYWKCFVRRTHLNTWKDTEKKSVDLCFEVYT